MKSTSLVTMSLMVLVAAFCLGFSQAWAKGPGGGHASTSRITQPTTNLGSKAMGDQFPSMGSLEPFKKGGTPPTTSLPSGPNSGTFGTGMNSGATEPPPY